METENELPPSTTLLRTENLSRRVGEKYLVKDVNLSLASGEVLAVVGPSGAGKSSFLRLLNRLDEPTDGTVYLDGQDYRDIPPRQLRQRVGMVMQAPNLFPGTVAENIAFGPRQRGQEFPRDQIEYLLEHVGLPALYDAPVTRLSGGEAQRVSLARTLANSPELLLLDEPTSALDETSREETEALIFELVRGQQLTCLLVTHDMAQARRTADRVMVMEAGSMVRFGSIAEVLDA